MIFKQRIEASYLQCLIEALNKTKAAFRKLNIVDFIFLAKLKRVIVIISLTALTLNLLGFFFDYKIVVSVVSLGFLFKLKVTVSLLCLLKGKSVAIFDLKGVSRYIGIGLESLLLNLFQFEIFENFDFLFQLLDFLNKSFYLVVVVFDCCLGDLETLLKFGYSL